MLKKCYFEPCLLQVLSTFSLLISVINPIATQRSLLFYRSHFMANFVGFFQDYQAKIIQSIQTRRTRVELIVADQILEGKKSKK